MPETSYTYRNGKTVKWTGANISVCTRCDELFNSVHAFDHHLKREREEDEAIHDVSGMPRNARGYLVTSLYTGPYAHDDDGEWEDTEDHYKVVLS